MWWLWQRPPFSANLLPNGIKSTHVDVHWHLVLFLAFTVKCNWLIPQIGVEGKVRELDFRSLYLTFNNTDQQCVYINLIVDLWRLQLHDMHRQGSSSCPYTDIHVRGETCQCPWQKLLCFWFLVRFDHYFYALTVEKQQIYKLGAAMRACRSAVLDLLFFNKFSYQKTETEQFLPRTLASLTTDMNVRVRTWWWPLTQGHP